MAPLKDVLVPDIGDFTDVPVVELLVAAGDVVAAEDPLVVVESDKATMEIPAPFAGTVKELKVAVGDTVSEGTVIVVMAAENGAAPEAGAAPAAEASPQAAHEPVRAVASPSTEAQSASSVASAIVAEAQSAPAPGGAPAPSGASTPGEPPASKADEHRTGREGSALDVHASPVVRRLARERGIDLGEITGSGPKGRITKEDLDAPRGAPAPAAAASAPAAGKGERVPLTRIQQATARNLSAAWQTIPHVTQHDDADITDLEAFRKQLNAEQKDVKVTMVALLLKACAAALDEFPRLASSLDGDELVVKAERHIGFAADTPNGLVVPVVRDVDQKGLLALAAELGELSGKARAGKLSPKEMSGAVFTISSLGGIGGTGFTPIVNPPQVAILGVVRSAMKPVWDGAAFQPRLVLPLSLSYDHRVIDGAAAARFCAHLAGLLADLRRVLL
jgi:pyruvate dehydrogenase E2 component (dihydrolipoamide acetyltransferase)